MGVIREATGIVGDVRGLASTGVRAVRTRLELLAIELAEEKAWLVRYVIVAVAALHLATFGLLLAVCAFVLYANEESRPLILGVCAAVFLLAGIAGAAYIYFASRKRHPILEDTIAVLKGDERALQGGLQGAGDD